MIKASDHNLDTLMFALHEKIEEYSDFLATKIEEGNPVGHVTYPPNNGFTNVEIASLKALQNKPELSSALKKLLADNLAGILFELFNFIDGTTDPNPDLGKWTELAFVDKDESIKPPNDMLHDQLFSSYWDWKKINDQ